MVEAGLYTHTIKKQWKRRLHRETKRVGGRPMNKCSQPKLSTEKRNLVRIGAITIFYFIVTFVTQYFRHNLLHNDGD